MQKTEILNIIRSDEFILKLKDIYLDDNVIDYQVTRYMAAVTKFEMLFGDGDISIFSSPGRCEIIGNHTDHQHGKVIAAAVNTDAIAVVKKTGDDNVRIVSGDNSELCINTGDLEKKESEEGTSAAVVKGVMSGLKGMGYELGGFSAYITSDVPIGSGLSSSASFEVLIGNIISDLFNENKIGAADIAIVGQYAENLYFGKPCGLMDQMACSVGGQVYIDFNNPADPKVETIGFDLNELGYSVCITDTKGSHENLTAEYAAIPNEMKSVASEFGKEVLNDVDKKEFLERMGELRDKCSDRAILRALHYFNENDRVINQAEAMKDNNLGRFLELENESGRSSCMYLQNIYVCNDSKQRNISLALAKSEEILANTGAFRVHGGGFAGTIQAFVPCEMISKYKEGMDSLFGHGACSVLKVRKYGGMKVL